jgi:ABC-type sugar transport system ATPase subunit
MNGSERRPVLAARGITKRYGSVRALRGVDFELVPGEVVGLIGDNGAGKSTLVSILSGLAQPDSGEVAVDDVTHTLHSPAQARAAGIETVFQNLALIPTLSIVDNVFLCAERFKYGRFGRALKLVDSRRGRREVIEVLAEFGLDRIDPRVKVTALSGGQRQAVAIARTILWGSRVVLMDEPCAALGVRQTHLVLSLIRRMRERGLAIVFISHNMPQVLQVCDRVVALRLGQKVLDAQRDGLTSDDLVAFMTGSRENGSRDAAAP